MNAPWKKLAGTVRPPFLLLTPACLLPAIAAARACCQPLDNPALWLTVGGALSAHVSVNALNEYHDYRSGLDKTTTRTPFSGGSGTLPVYPELATAALWLGIGALLITVTAGIFLLRVSGPLLLPFGLAGILLVILYSIWIVKRPVLCLLSAGLGFGPFMVVGAGLAITGKLLTETLWVAVVIGFAVNNLLLLNQIPDREADAAVGRRTLPVTAGVNSALRVYLLFTTLSLMVLLAAVTSGELPVLSLLAAAPLAACFFIERGVRRAGTNIAAMTPYLAGNVAICLTVPVLLAVGLYPP